MQSPAITDRKPCHARRVPSLRTDEDAASTETASWFVSDSARMLFRRRLSERHLNILLLPASQDSEGHGVPRLVLEQHADESLLALHGLPVKLDNDVVRFQPRFV